MYSLSLSLTSAAESVVLRPPFRLLSGAGIGLAGLAAAAAGAHVLQTDLPSVVDGTIRPNISRNADAGEAEEASNSDDTSEPWAGARVDGCLRML